MLANRVEPDQTPHSVVSDMGLQCLPRYGLKTIKQHTNPVPAASTSVPCPTITKLMKFSLVFTDI